MNEKQILATAITRWAKNTIPSKLAISGQFTIDIILSMLLPQIAPMLDILPDEGVIDTVLSLVDGMAQDAQADGHFAIKGIKLSAIDIDNLKKEITIESKNATKDDTLIPEPK